MIHELVFLYAYTGLLVGALLVATLTTTTLKPHQSNFLVIFGVIAAIALWPWFVLFSFYHAVKRAGNTRGR